MYWIWTLVIYWFIVDYEQDLETAENELAVVEIELQDLQERKNVLLDKIAELKAVICQQEECKEQQHNKAWEGTGIELLHEMFVLFSFVFQFFNFFSFQSL